VRGVVDQRLKQLPFQIASEFNLPRAHAVRQPRHPAMNRVMEAFAYGDTALCTVKWRGTTFRNMKMGGD
jgi:hypothetical protein